MEIKLGREIFSAFPKKKLTNDKLSELNPVWNSDKITQKLGIESRSVLGEHESILLYAEKALAKLLECYEDLSIDCLVYVSNVGEYVAPGNGHVLRQRANLESVKVFDLNAGCTGYVDGLVMCKALISSGMYNSICLVTGDSYTKEIDIDDFSNSSLFGDAATASLVTNCNIEGWVLGESAGNTYDGVEHLNITREKGLFMDGKKVFDFAVNRVLETMDSFPEIYNAYIFHQANKYMINYLVRKMRIDTDKVLWNLREFGNTVGSTIPLVLEKNKSFKGSMLLIGFGIGLSVSAIELLCKDKIINSKSA